MTMNLPTTPVPTPVRTGRGQAHAKCILLGEHAVVYGVPAIAFPVLELGAHADVTVLPSRDALRSRAEVATRPAPVRLELVSDAYRGPLDRIPEPLAPVATAITTATEAVGLPDLIPGGTVSVRLESDIPDERGLGSSAAVSASIVRALADAAGRQLAAEQEFALIQAAERIAHTNPSGLDARAVTASGPIRFDRASGRATPLALGGSFHFVIADTGIAGSTKHAVAGVSARRSADGPAVDRLIDRLGALAEAAVRDLAEGNREQLGERMNEAHLHLAQLGVSHPVLDRLQAAAQSAGALGAKLTGGGLGGCVLALAPSAEAAATLQAALGRAGARRTWMATMGAA